MAARELGLPQGNPLALPRTSGGAGRGEISFTTPGTYLWTPPKGVTKVCAVLVGPGGASYYDSGTSVQRSGGGGALAWANDIPVSSNETYTIVVGATGGFTYPTGTVLPTATTAFGLTADFGKTWNGSTTVGTGAPTLGNVGSSRGGGTGGNNASGTGSGGGGTGGGGAGGYSGNGGQGRGQSASPAATGGAGGGGGGGGAGGAGGGGVGIYGEGSSGIAGADTGYNRGGGGGSGGLNGRHPYENANRKGDFGGGEGNDGFSSSIGGGAVRILWGAGRAFPSTDVGPS